MSEAETIGAQFARALAAKDFARIGALLHPEVDFRGMTPNRFWEASGGDQVITDVLQQWFEAEDEIRSLDQLETGGVADRERVGYRLSVRCPDGDYVVEQQAYLSTREGRIDWMRVLCAGYRPAP